MRPLTPRPARGLHPMALGIALVALSVTACVRYVLSPENVASARLGAKITRKLMGLDAGEEERRQALLGADYCLWDGILWRADAGELDAGIACRPLAEPSKDGGDR